MRYLHRFTLIAWEANAMLDRGETLDIEETREKIHDGSLVDWFSKTFGDQTDMSLYDEEDKRETARVLTEIAAELMSAESSGSSAAGWS